VRERDEARAEVRRLTEVIAVKDAALAEAASIGNRYGMFSDDRPMNDHARMAQKALAALSRASTKSTKRRKE
jgi:hypothetical protein